MPRVFTSIGVAAVSFFLLSDSGCGGKRLHKANVDEVTEGMSKKQVESILGIPTNIDSKDWVVSKKTVYVYQQGKEAVTLTFKEDKLQLKESTLSE